jgi:gliding motility-associated-like protein
MNTCGKSECSSVDVFVDQEAVITVPNAFSPDGDGLNDVFKAYTPNSFASYNLYIYDRWGQLIFESEKPEEGWDGKVNNNDAPEGSYVWLLVYQIDAKGIEKEQLKKQGVVTLVK